MDNTLPAPPKTLQEWRSQGIKLHLAGAYPRSVPYWNLFSSHMAIPFGSHHPVCTNGLQTMRRVRLMVSLTEQYTAKSNRIHNALT